MTCTLRHVVILKSRLERKLLSGGFTVSLFCRLVRVWHATLQVCTQRPKFRQALALAAQNDTKPAT
jgi:hypothetical protein